MTRYVFLSPIVFALGASSITSMGHHELPPLQSAELADPTPTDGAGLYLEHEVPEELFSYDVSRPVTVAIWSKVAQQYPHAKNIANCNLNLTYAIHDGHRHGITLDRDADISTADVVLINVAMLSRNYLLPRHKYKGQLWIAYCSEPVNFDNADLDGGDCRLLRDSATMSVMDAVSSYDGFSDFPSYFTPPTETQMRRERGWSDASSPQALATFASSDCRSKWRMEKVSQLNASMEALGMHGAVLSYGACLNTVKETPCGSPGTVQKEEWSDMVVSIVNRCMARKFAIVSENTDSPWYITEKLWFAFASGQVPVYFGPEEAKQLVPPGSVIFANDYDSPDALAAALVSFGAQELETAQAFKDGPVSEWGGWLTARRFSHMTLLPRICEAASKRPPVAPEVLNIGVPTAPLSVATLGSDAVQLRGGLISPTMMVEHSPRTCRALRCCGHYHATC